MPSHAESVQDLSVAERRQRVAHLYLTRHTQVEIARTLGIGQTTVSRDLAAIEAAWGKAALLDMHAAKVRELERIDALEREAWEAWRRSQEQAVKSRVQQVNAHVVVKPDGREVTVPERVTKMREAKGRDGSHEFLTRIQWCIDTRIRILGLDRPGETAEGATVKALLDSLADLRERDAAEIGGEEAS